MLFCVFVGVFVFVAVYVAGARALDVIEAAQAAQAEARRARIKRGALPGGRYVGPVYNRHGREVI